MVAAFPVADDDQVMLVTDRGQVIRIPVDDIRIAGRNTQGVTLFDVAEDEHVVSVARLLGAAEANGGEAGDDAARPATMGRAAAAFRMAVSRARRPERGRRPRAEPGGPRRCRGRRVAWASRR